MRFRLKRKVKLLVDNFNTADAGGAELLECFIAGEYWKAWLHLLTAVG